MFHILLTIGILHNSLVKFTASSNLSSIVDTKNLHLTEEFKIPSPTEVYEILIGMQSEYPEGKYWTDASSGTYTWKGGTGNNREIANMGTGCVYFCFHLSDTAFGTLPARLLRPGTFKITDIKTGDILRVEFNRHSVIVLQVYDESVVVAEGNYNKVIHWGRVLTKSEVENADHLITRYPQGYIPPEDPNANKEIGSGSFGPNDQLHWILNGGGYLTISGNGNCPDFDPTNRPWESYIEKVISVIVESGVTSIGANAFRDSNILGLTISGTIKSIGDSAFRGCSKLTMVSIPEGTEIIGSNSFRGCISLKGVTFPSTIKEVQAGALAYNTALMTVKFIPGDITVTIGDSLFTECYSLIDLTLPTLMDCISSQMFYNSRLPYLFIPNGVKSIGDAAFQHSSITTLVIPGTVEQIGMLALGPNSNFEYIYFCGTEAQWNAIPKGSNMQFISGKTIHYVADIESVKIVNENGQSVEGTSIQMDIKGKQNFSIKLTFSDQGETPLDSRYVEWFCVVPNTPTNDIKAIESAADAGNVVELNIVTTKVDNDYKVELNVNALNKGDARIIGHVKKNPASSMANNQDHIYSYLDIKVSDSTTSPSSSSSDQTITSDESNNDHSSDQQNPDSDVSLTENESYESIPSNDETEKDQNSDEEKKGISKGAIAGIVVAVVVVLAGAGVAIFIYFKRKNSYQESNSNHNEDEPKDNQSDTL